MYLANAGERTLFSIEVINGRTIRAHSYYDLEDEILLLPGTRLEVQSQLRPAPGLQIIHLKQIKPTETLYTNFHLKVNLTINKQMNTLCIFRCSSLSIGETNGVVQEQEDYCWIEFANYSLCGRNYYRFSNWHKTIFFSFSFISTS